MKVNDFIQALREIKQKYPQYDTAFLEVLVDDKMVGSLSLDLQKFAIKLVPAATPKEESETSQEGGDA